MDGKYLIIGGIVLLAIVISGGHASANNTAINLDALRGDYDSADVDRLQNVLNVLGDQGLTAMQIRFMLAQILQETGLFTDNPNYHAIDQLNNYAGISNSNGSLRSYNNIADFITDYLRVLNLPSHYPIEATSINDFNTRLKANGYYTDSATTYGNNLNYYYNLLP